jgi:hypothetical protein
MMVHFLSLSIPLTLVIIGLGGYVLNDAISSYTPSQLIGVITGSALVALGLIALFPQLRAAARWLQEMRYYRNRDL